MANLGALYGPLILRKLPDPMYCAVLSVFVALGIEHATRMRRIILSGAACLVLPYFYMHPTNSAIFGGGGHVCKSKNLLSWAIDGT